MGDKILYDKNVLYLSLAASPVVGFLYIDYNLILSVVFLFFLAMGVSLASDCITIIKSKKCISLLLLFSCYGFFIMQFWKGTSLSVIGTSLLGIGAGGMAFSLSISSLNNSGNPAAPFSLTTLLVIGFLWKILLGRDTYFFLCFALVFSLYFIWKTKFTFPESNISFHEIDPVLSEKKNTLLVLFCAFVSILSFSLGTSIITIVESISDYQYIPALLVPGVVLGSVLYTLVSSRKGAYSGSIFLLFLCETSVSFSFYECGFIAYLLSVLSTGLCAGGIAAQPFWISSFIIGKTTGCNSAKWAIISETAGLSLSIFAKRLPIFCKTDPHYSPIPLLVILVINFFLIFYLWKKKLILLKT